MNAAIVFSDDRAHAGCELSLSPSSLLSALDEQQNDAEPSQPQDDLEDQTLPAPLATLPLDWRPFPHLHVYVNDSSSVLVALLRPPPPDNA